jgi:exodeoxyribonuclease VIII
MITIETLRERPLSYSSIKEFAKSPRHYINYINAKREPSKEMNFGSMIHALLMYPRVFNDSFAVCPDIDRRTKEGKLAWENFQSSAEGKIVVSESELSEANSIIDMALSRLQVKNTVENCHTFELEFRTEVSGLPFRGFVDGLSNNYILEVKTMSDASPQNITKEFYNRKYHIQAGLYNLVYNLPVKYIILETKSPYNYMVADATEDYIKAGQDELYKLIDRFKQCIDMEAFDAGYQFNLDKIFEVGLPAWVK